MLNKKPIGVFDSGLGGLTVVRELKKLLPSENIIYFGDTGRVPYGTRSRETIAAYATEAERFLLSKDVKLIVAACGTVSSVAAFTGDNLPVEFIGVVESAAVAAAKSTKNKKIGVIGTAATVSSGSYDRYIKAILPNAKVVSAACSLFVPLVENGWIERDNEVTRLTAKKYLSPLISEGIDTLILGCTHFPVLESIIADVMGNTVKLINTGVTTSAYIKDYLNKNDLGNDINFNPTYKYFFTDKNSAFESTVSLLMGENIENSTNFLAIESLARN